MPALPASSMLDDMVAADRKPARWVALAAVVGAGILLARAVDDLNRRWLEQTWGIPIHSRRPQPGDRRG